MGESLNYAYGIIQLLLSKLSTLKPALNNILIRIDLLMQLLNLVLAVHGYCQHKLALHPLAVGTRDQHIVLIGY